MKVIQNRLKVIQIGPKVIRIRGSWPLTVGRRGAVPQSQTGAPQAQGG